MKEHFRALRQVLQLWSEDKLGESAPRPGAFPAARGRGPRGHPPRRRPARAGGGSGGPIAVTVQQVLAAPPSSAIALNLQIRNSSLSQFFFNAEAFHLASFNGIPHLEDPERHALRTYG